MEITKVLEFLDKINEKAKKVDLLFRGHKNAKWNLLPKIARYTEGKDIRNLEKRILWEFKRLSPTFLEKEKEPTNNFDWLTLAQHYGLPTRFLDWTYNPLVALWFVVCQDNNEDNTQKNNGTIYLFSPSLEDYQVQQNLCTNCINPFEINQTMIFRPINISKRIVNQTSVFTLHFIDKNNKLVELKEDKNFKEKIFEFTVPYTKFKDIREELHRCNINASSIFADLAGLCQHLEWRYFQR